MRTSPDERAHYRRDRSGIPAKLPCRFRLSRDPGGPAVRAGRATGPSFASPEHPDVYRVDAVGARGAVRTVVEGGAGNHDVFAELLRHATPEVRFSYLY